MEKPVCDGDMCVLRCQHDEQREPRAGPTPWDHDAAMTRQPAGHSLPRDRDVAWEHCLSLPVAASGAASEPAVAFTSVWDIKEC